MKGKSVFSCECAARQRFPSAEQYVLVLLTGHRGPYVCVKSAAADASCLSQQLRESAVRILQTRYKIYLQQTGIVFGQRFFS